MILTNQEIFKYSQDIVNNFSEKFKSINEWR